MWSSSGPVWSGCENALCFEVKDVVLLNVVLMVGSLLKLYLLCVS